MISYPAGVDTYHDDTHLSPRRRSRESKNSIREFKEITKYPRKHQLRHSVPPSVDVLRIFVDRLELGQPVIG
jgi:hypothetical protein